jgi:hypothetical protein
MAEWRMGPLGDRLHIIAVLGVATTAGWPFARKARKFFYHKSLLQNPFFRESKRNRMQYEYESEREPRSILQVPHNDRQIS